MAYIPNVYKMDMAGFEGVLQNLGDNNPYTLDHIITADYVYHRDDNDYDDGLSFLDRIYKKMRNTHPNWDDIQDLKVRIVQAGAPQDEFMAVLQELFADPADVAYYGL